MLNNTSYQQECSYDPPCEKVEYSIKMDALETRWQSQSACQQLGIYGKCVFLSILLSIENRIQKLIGSMISINFVEI